MEAYLKAVSYYLPETLVSNEKLVEEFPEWTVEKVAGKVGINNRYIAAEDEFVSDLAVKVANKLFAEHEFDRSKVDFILLCTQSPDYFLPTTACLVQNALNIPKTCGAIDINQGCSGYIYGLALAKGLVISGIATNVLLITADLYSKHIHESDKGNRTIFGDAASASIISTDGFAKIGNFDLGTDGAGAENLIVKNGAMKKPKSNSEDFNQDDHLYMNGSEIFNFTLEAVPGLLENTLAKNELNLEEIDWFLFHQANRFMLNHLRKKLGIDEQKFLIFMENCGNTVSSTIPILLVESLANDTISTNNKLLLAGFGVGYSWGGTVLTMNS
jgi:3-oxoacyl-[acyl-carrier-protein] synthase III